MKIFSTLVILFLAGESFAADNNSHHKRIAEIRSISRESKAATWAEKCTKLAAYYAENISGTEPFRIKLAKEETIQLTTTLKLPSMEEFTDEQLEAEHSTLQSCRFIVNKYFTGWCPECKGIQRISQPALVNQKLATGEYVVHMLLLSGVIGKLRPGPEPFILSSTASLEKGNTHLFAIRGETEGRQRFDGFSQEIFRLNDLTPAGASAVLCRFNQLISAMNKKYPKKFRCGWNTVSEDFYQTGVASLACAPKSSFTEENYSKFGYYVTPFDYQFCR